MSTPVVIERMDGGPPLIVHGAEAMLPVFFEWDGLSRSYDRHATKGEYPNKITRNDLVKVNTLGARTRASAWSGVLDKGELAWLADIQPSWTLFDGGDEAWVDRIRPAMVTAFGGLTGPYLGLAVVTKMLHLKRPGLFPIVDGLVLDLVGGRGKTGIEVVSHLREVGARNRTVLSDIAGQVAKSDTNYTEVRVLDAILWSIHPASSFAPHLRGRVEVAWTS